MITQAIRFYSMNRDGTEKASYGKAWMTEDGELDYANEVVRGIMAPTVNVVGPAKAFAYFQHWASNGVVSEPVNASS